MNASILKDLKGQICTAPCLQAYDSSPPASKTLIPMLKVISYHCVKKCINNTVNTHDTVLCCPFFSICSVQ